MAEVINMPRLSDTMEEGVVAKWLKQKGDKVEIKYRDVHSRTLTNDVQYFPPKERVY